MYPGKHLHLLPLLMATFMCLSVIQPAQSTLSIVDDNYSNDWYYESTHPIEPISPEHNIRFGHPVKITASYDASSIGSLPLSYTSIPEPIASFDDESIPPPLPSTFDLLLGREPVASTVAGGMWSILGDTRYDFVPIGESTVQLTILPDDPIYNELFTPGKQVTAEFSIGYYRYLNENPEEYWFYSYDDIWSATSGNRFHVYTTAKTYLNILPGPEPGSFTILIVGSIAALRRTR